MTSRQPMELRPLSPIPSIAAALPSLALAAGLVLAACATGASQHAAMADVVPAPDERGHLERWGFTAFWDPNSATSLTRHADALDVAITTWIALDSTTGAPTVLHAEAQRVGGKPARSMALVTSWHGERFHPDAVRRLASDTTRLRTAAAEVARRAAALGHHGLVLDFEGHAVADTAILRRVVAAFAAAARAAGAAPVSVAIPATDTSAYPARLFIAAGAAYVIPMLYDQHWAGGEPGPISAPDWVRQWLGVRMAEVGAAHVVAGLPFYGYRWTATGKGETVTHAEAVAASARAGHRLTRDAATHTMRASLGKGEVWVTDAGLVQRLLAEVSKAGVGRVAFWYVGQEDPAVWRVLQK